MDLSIIVINWNTREMTRDCLQTAFAGLGALEAEIIVVDNASEDGSADMVAADFPQAILIRNAENRGFAAANNQGMDIARGRHILLLNSDTLVHGDVLAASVAWLDAHEDVGAMGCRVMNTDGTEQINNTIFPTFGRMLMGLSGLAKLPGMRGTFAIGVGPAREVEVIAGCYLMVRRRVIEQVGMLDEAFFFFGEETDWGKRMRDAGWKLMLAPVGEITHFGGGSVKKLNHRRDVLLSEATVRLQRKHGGLVAGIAAFVLITAFNSSRAIFWSLLALFRRQGRAPERARHFRAVTAQTADTWPRLPKTTGAA